jgi:ATP-binding cassette subfamily B protein
MASDQTHPSSRGSRTRLAFRLIRPHWKPLALALAAVAGETLADILEPWPIKLVVDNVLQ